jgi:hypothetical protein
MFKKAGWDEPHHLDSRLGGRIEAFLKVMVEVYRADV